MNRIPLVLLAAAVVAASPWASAQGCTDSKGQDMNAIETVPVSGDIVETAQAAGKFKTLITAAKAAGMVEALKAPGPFTVFAPSDEAFARLPAGTIDHLLKPENKAKLAAILGFHVVPGRLAASDVLTSTGALTLQGQRLAFRSAKDGVHVGDARVVQADVEAANGVIHVIDRVLMPTDKNLVEVATAAGKFTTLLAAAKAAGLAETLASGGPFTVFAPTDEAFARLPAGTVDGLLKPANKEKLVTILKLHVIPRRLDSAGALSAGSARSLDGVELRFTADGNALSVNGAKIAAADLNASNGIIHVVDTVILPR